MCWQILLVCNVCETLSGSEWVTGMTYLPLAAISAGLIWLMLALSEP